MTLPELTLTEPVGDERNPLVVLAHSLGTGPLIWERVVPSLASNFRVSLLTLPGHGDAPVPETSFTMDDLADAAAALIRECAAGSVGFAGVSIGGALALTLALRHPDLIAGAASIASAASLGSADHWSARAAFVREQSTSALVASSASVWFAPDSIASEPEITGRMLRVLQEVSDEGYARCAEALGTYDVTDRLAEIRVPILAVGGEHDGIAPEERQDEIVRHVPGARKVMIEGAGHQPPAEQPARVTTVLDEFFREVTQ